MPSTVGIGTTFAAEPEALIYPHINEILDLDPWDFSLVVRPPFDEAVVRAKHRALRLGETKMVYEPRQDDIAQRLYDVAVERVH